MEDGAPLSRAAARAALGLPRRETCTRWRARIDRAIGARVLPCRARTSVPLDAGRVRLELPAAHYAALFPTSGRCRRATRHGRDRRARTAECRSARKAVGVDRRLKGRRDVRSLSTHAMLKIQTQLLCVPFHLAALARLARTASRNPNRPARVRRDCTVCPWPGATATDPPRSRYGHGVIRKPRREGAPMPGMRLPPAARYASCYPGVPHGAAFDRQPGARIKSACVRYPFR